jgi:hypothetical protein
VECSLAFVVAFLINVAVVVVAGSICNAAGGNLSPADAAACGDLTLQSTPLLLRVRTLLHCAACARARQE